jgi:hypothetical protein
MIFKQQKLHLDINTWHIDEVTRSIEESLVVFSASCYTKVVSYQC